MKVSLKGKSRSRKRSHMKMKGLMRMMSGKRIV